MSCAKREKVLLAEAGGTLDGLVAQLQRDERQSDREFVRPRSRTVAFVIGAKTEHNARR